MDLIGRWTPASRQYMVLGGYCMPDCILVSTANRLSQWLSTSGSVQWRMSSGTVVSAVPLLLYFHSRKFLLIAHFVLVSILSGMYPFCIMSISASGITWKRNLFLGNGLIQFGRQLKGNPLLTHGIQDSTSKSLLPTQKQLCAFSAILTRTLNCY